MIEAVLGEAVVSIAANVNPLTIGLKGAELALRGFAGVAAGITQTVVTGFSTLGTALAEGVQVGAKIGADSLIRATQSAINFEAALAKVKKTTGFTTDELNQFQRQIEGIAQSMAGSKRSDLMDIATMGGRLGINSDKIGRFTRDIAMITIALDDIPAEEAATRIARILNVFHLGAENTIRFASALNKLDDTSTASGRDILDITTRLASSAALLGLAPTKVLAIAAALKDAGVENEVAGSSMSQVLQMMATHTANFALVAGTSIQDFTAMLRRDPLDALRAFMAGLKRLDSQTQFKVISQMGLDGVRAQTTLLGLASVVDKLNGYVTDAQSEWSTLNSITKEYEAQSKTVKSQLQRMYNAFDILTTKVGDTFLPVIKALANSFLELAIDIQKYVENNTQSVGRFLERFVAMARRVSVVFSEWPTLINYVGAIIYDAFLKINEIANRLGTRAWEALKLGAVVAGDVLKSTFDNFSTFLIDLFAQLGKRLAYELIEGMKAQFAEEPVLRLLFPELQLALGLLPKNKPPEVKPRTDLLSSDKLLKLSPEGAKAQAALRNSARGPLFNDLPDNAFETAAQQAQLDNAANKKDNDRERRERENLPKPPATPKPASNTIRLNALLYTEYAKRLAARIFSGTAVRADFVPPRPFRGTEAQAGRILRARERNKKRREHLEKQQQAQRRPPLPRSVPMSLGDKLVAQALGRPVDGFRIPMAIQTGTPTATVRKMRREERAKRTQRQEGGQLNQAMLFAQMAELNRPGTKGGDFVGLADFAKRVQAGALSTEDYQKRALGLMENTVTELQKMQMTLMQSPAASAMTAVPPA